jgi:hypothetical protein
MKLLQTKYNTQKIIIITKLNINKINKYEN